MTLDLSDSGLLDMPPKAWATREKKNRQIGLYKNGKLLWLKWFSRSVLVKTAHKMGEDIFKWYVW